MIHVENKKLIRVGHSPDSDDAFMFYALKHGLVSDPQLIFEIERRDIEELNQLAVTAFFDITAISFHAYAHLSDHYAILSSGSSMAEKDYGPMLVVDQKKYQGLDVPVTKIDHWQQLRKEFKGKTIAVPGDWTTSCLILRVMLPEIQTVAMRFDRITDAVLNGVVDGGLLIHEGQLQYHKQGLACVAKLTDFWNAISLDRLQARLPLPLGGNAVKKSLGAELMSKLSRLQLESIAYAMKNHEQARDYARQFKRDLTPEEADQYLSWYANERTLDMGSDGRAALRLLYDIAYDSGVIDHPVVIEICEPKP